jgi:hypothetical protein
MIGNTHVNDIAGTAKIFHEEDNEEICQIQRWSSSHKAKISVPQPHALNTYKNFMAGVDLHDWMPEKQLLCVERHGIGVFSQG